MGIRRKTDFQEKPPPQAEQHPRVGERRPHGTHGAKRFDDGLGTVRLQRWEQRGTGTQQHGQRELGCREKR